MTSREIINRLIENRQPARFGMDFNGNGPSDFLHHSILKLKYPYDPAYLQWGRHEALLKKTDGFSGDVMMNHFGDLYGRLNGITKGECIKGALEDGWEKLNDFCFPEIDESFDLQLAQMDLKNSDRYVVGGLPFAIFSRLRDARLMANALMDTLLEEENVKIFLEMEMVILKKAVEKAAQFGFDAVMFGDDLGTQNALFFSPATFRDLFKPFYTQLCEVAHHHGLKVFMHSCGRIYEIIDDLIEAGIDVFQFDQPELSGSDVLAKEFGNRATFYCPVDIQKIMATGDKKTIEEGALFMLNNFKSICGGKMIFKDYPTWHDINVKEEWADWARDVIVANIKL